MSKKPFDVAGFCIAWEEGELNHEQTVEGFQKLIDTGFAWKLQGMYGRMARDLINDGFCRSENADSKPVELHRGS